MSQKRVMSCIFRGVVLLSVAFFTACTAKRAVQGRANENLIIYYDPSAGNEELLKAARQYGSSIIYVYQNINGIAVTVPADKSIADAIRYFGELKGVLYVTEDKEMQLD